MTDPDDIRTFGGYKLVVDEEWARQLERDLDDYLSGLDPDDELPQDTLSGVGFCGCGVCVTREMLSLVVPRVLAGQEDGKLRLVDRPRP